MNKHFRWIIALSFIILISLSSCKGQAVIDAEKAIKSIGDVTLDSKNDISNAEKYYNILTESEKEKVGNRIVLANAKEEYQRLLELNTECPFGLTWGASLDEILPRINDVDVGYSSFGDAVVDVKAKKKSQYYKESQTLFFFDDTNGLNSILVDCSFSVKSKDETYTEADLLSLNYKLRDYIVYMDNKYGKHSYNVESQSDHPSWNKHSYQFEWHLDYYSIRFTTLYFDKPYVVFSLTDEGEAHFCE